MRSGTDRNKNEIHLVVSEYDLSSKPELDHLEEGQANIHLILTLSGSGKIISRVIQGH